MLSFLLGVTFVVGPDIITSWLLSVFIGRVSVFEFPLKKCDEVGAGWLTKTPGEAMDPVD